MNELHKRLIWIHIQFYSVSFINDFRRGNRGIRSVAVSVILTAAS